MILEPSRWARLRPPFRTLAVGLADAEELLNGSKGQPITGRWARLAAATGQPSACTSALNRVLADLRMGLQLAPSPEGGTGSPHR